MNLQFRIRILNFFLLLILFVSISTLIGGCKKDSNSNTRIVYTDLNPDTTISGLGDFYYSLDLNNDGLNDYDLETSYGRLPCLLGGPLGQEILKGFTFVSITPYHTNSVGDSSIADGTKLAIMMGAGKIIKQQGIGWNNSARQLMVHVDGCANIHDGLWSGSNDQFLPLRLELGSLVYFGWVRLDVGVDGIKLIIKDYAFNSIPNQPILSGQTK